MQQHQGTAGALQLHCSRIPDSNLSLDCCLCSVCSLCVCVGLLQVMVSSYVPYGHLYLAVFFFLADVFIRRDFELGERTQQNNSSRAQQWQIGGAKLGLEYIK